MASHPRDMNLRAAALAGVLLAIFGMLLLWAADEATDATAVAGGILLVVSGSLLGLTVLARRWDRARSGYVRTVVETGGSMVLPLAGDDAGAAQASEDAAAH